MDLYFGDLRLPEISDTSVSLPFRAYLLSSATLAEICSNRSYGPARHRWLYFLKRKAAPILAGLLCPHSGKAQFGLSSLAGDLVSVISRAALEDFDFCRWGRRCPHSNGIGFRSSCSQPVSGTHGRSFTAPIDARNGRGRSQPVRRAKFFWFQFVPPVAGVIWFVLYWRKHRQDWNWQDQMPVLVTASLLTTS